MVKYAIIARIDSVLLIFFTALPYLLPNLDHSIESFQLIITMNFFVEAASSTTTTAESNYQSVSDFWLFVVYCLVVIVVVIFFSFYFNRVLGQVVTFLINQYTWRKHNAYIEVGK